MLYFTCLPWGSQHTIPTEHVHPATHDQNCRVMLDVAMPVASHMQYDVRQIKRYITHTEDSPGEVLGPGQESA